MVARSSSSIVAPDSAVERSLASPLTPAVGRSVRRRDEPAEVTGATRYRDDLVVLSARHGVAVRSTEPHARLLGIERDPAFEWSRAIAGPAPTS